MDNNMEIMNEEKLTVKTQTVVRTICLIIALANQLLIWLGKGRIPFTDDEIYQGVSYIVLAVVALWNWWKNNSFTKHAIAADEYLAILRQKK